MKLQKTLLLLFVVWWSSVGCFAYESEPTSFIPLDQITQRKHLLHATQTSTATFFSRLLNRRLRKVNVGNWSILHRDGVFIYYGYPVFKNFLTNERQIERLYKVSQFQVNETFPDFEAWTQYGHAPLQKALQPLFETPIAWIGQTDFVFDPEAPNVFKASTTAGLKNVAQCRYTATFSLPTQRIVALKPTPIRQQISPRCPLPVVTPKLLN